MSCQLLQPARREASWPNSARWIAFLKFMGMFYLLFFPVYFGTGWIAAPEKRSIGLYFDWEKDIPLVAWMVWPYLSLFPLFLLPLAHLRAEEIAVLSRQSTLALLIAGAFFILAPTRCGFAPTLVAGFNGHILSDVGAVDTVYNLAPSLHVVFGALILLACGERSPPFITMTYRLWLAIMAASTILVHQHHLLDVLSGFGLAIAVRRMAPFASGVRRLRVAS